MNRPNDELTPANTPTPESVPSASRSRGGWGFPLAALGLVVVCGVVGTCLGNWLKSPAPQENKVEDRTDMPKRLFRNWAKPDFVVVLSAQQHGYMLPCGCSTPQKGGLERRYNLIQLLKARGWPVVAVDLGDVAQTRGPANLQNVQGLLKYRYSMMALKEMGYLAVGIGENETGGGLSLASVEGEWAANSAQPALVAGNLTDVENKFPFLKTFETQTVPGTSIRVGVTSIVGPTVAAKIKDPAVQFAISPSTAPSISEQLKKMRAEKVDLPILLYHGTATEKQEALRCAKAFPEFPLILAQSEEDEPPDHPDQVDHKDIGIINYVFHLGHKAKYIGVIGVYHHQGSSFSFKYQLVSMDEDFLTPPEKEDKQPIVKLMEDYTRELKNKDYLGQYHQSEHILQAMNPVPNLRNPGKGIPEYIGTEACKKCHEHAYEVWQASAHSHAYQTLMDAKHPSLRQYDGECIVCHTVGFGYKTGYANETDTKKLKNVGCESCHGPGSLHAKNPENQEWRDRMNQPWLTARKKGNVQAKNRDIEKFCVTCHDIDNDVHWVPNPANNRNPFQQKWEKGKIVHNNPPG